MKRVDRLRTVGLVALGKVGQQFLAALGDVLEGGCIFSESAAESPEIAAGAELSDMRFLFQIIGFEAFLAVLS